MIKPCDNCGLLAPRKWKHGYLWLCVDCVSTKLPAQACVKCEFANVWPRFMPIIGIERFADLKSDSDNYMGPQTLAYRCERGHYMFGDTQWGPDHEKAGEPVEPSSRQDEAKR